jgi:hypothetical protein
LVTGIRLLRLRAVGPALPGLVVVVHLEVAEAEILLPLAAGLLVVVAAVESHHLAVAVELRLP